MVAFAAGVRRNPSLARKLVANLPQSSWLKKNDNMLTGDFDKFGDAGVTDLLLHHCDHAFRVPEVRGRALVSTLLPAFSVLGSFVTRCVDFVTMDDGFCVECRCCTGCRPRCAHPNHNHTCRRHIPC